MGRKSKGAQAAAERATAIVETIRPIVNRAMSDPDLHDALKRAFATGRDVSDEISHKSPGDAARKIASDRKLHRRVGDSARDLQKAVGGVIEPPRRRGRLRRVLAPLAVIGALGAGAVVLARRLRGGGGDV